MTNEHQYSDLPLWMWAVELNGHPRLFLSNPALRDSLVNLWRWSYFLGFPGLLDRGEGP